MPRLDYKWCKRCHGHVTAVGVLSHERLCEVCSMELLSENVLSLAAHSGEPFKRWRRGMAASVGAVLTDDLQSNP